MKGGRLFLMACVILAASRAGAEPLGRLFFTPEQRALLDRQRRDGIDFPVSAAIRLDGLAVRAGKTVGTWINGRAHDRPHPVGLAGLRVGESLDPVTRQKLDLLPDGSIARSAR